MLALADLRPGARVLDVACGTGLVTLRAATEVGPTGCVVATDISQAMVDAVQAAAAARGLTQVAAQRQDAEELDLEHDTFDVALCAFGLMYVVDPIQAQCVECMTPYAPVAAWPLPYGVPVRNADGRRSFRLSTDGSRRMSVRCSFSWVRVMRCAARWTPPRSSTSRSNE